MSEKDKPTQTSGDKTQGTSSQQGQPTRSDKYVTVINEGEKGK
jgi:hypothetical protein